MGAVRGGTWDAAWPQTRQALAAGRALARRAAREAGVPLAVTAAGWTAVFVAGRAALPAAAGSALGWTGLALVGLMAAPKLGALHRLAAGAEARDAVGPGGLQWTALELRLAATAVALAAGGAILFAVEGGLAVAATAALRPLGRVSAGPFGPLAVGVLLILPGLAAATAAAWAVGRFCVTLAADAAERAPRFARGWILTRGAGAAPAAVWLVTTGLPTAGLLAAPAVLDAAAAAAGTGGRWGAPEATAVGAVLATLTQFVFAPLNAGALAELRRAGLRREASRAVDMPGALGDNAPPRAASSLPVREPEPQPA